MHTGLCQPSLSIFISLWEKKHKLLPYLCDLVVTHDNRLHVILEVYNRSALWRGSQIFSGCVEEGMKFSKYLSVGFLKIMAYNLFIFCPFPGHK